MTSTLTIEQWETVEKEVKNKVNKEKANQHTQNHFYKWETHDLEVYLMPRALKDANKFNTGTKGDNFLKYVRQVIKMDFIDFTRKFLKGWEGYSGDLFGTPNNHDGENFREEELFGSLDSGYQDIHSEEANQYILSDSFGLSDRQKEIYQLCLVEGYSQKEASILLYGTEDEKTFLKTCRDMDTVNKFMKKHKGYKTSTINRDFKTIQNKLVDNIEKINSFY